MEKPADEVKEESRKKYVKPELTRHKPLREVTMTTYAFGSCDTCAD